MHFYNFRNQREEGAGSDNQAVRRLQKLPFVEYAEPDYSAFVTAHLITIALLLTSPVTC